MRRSREMDWFLGKEVGAYRLVRRLGVGGMAAVYLGEPISGSGAAVAVKILHRRHVTDADIVARFVDEAQAANRIEHPGIVRVFYCGRSDDVGVYLVLELLEGQTLDERKKQREKLPTEQVVRVLDQVASAMQAAHDAGVIHRDLKASNVFLARDPEAPRGERAKVLDFGVAKLLRGGANTRTGYVIGTFSHMPPEQMLDSKGVDARADVYSLGALGYFLLCGRYAYTDEQVDRFLLGHRLPRPVLERAPPSLARVILRAMEHDREARYPTMAAFAAALRDAQRADELMRTSVVVAPAARVLVAAEFELQGDTSKRAAGTLDLAPEQMAALARAPARDFSHLSEVSEASQASQRSRRRRSWTLGLAAAGMALGLGVFVASSGTSLEQRDDPSRGALAPRPTRLDAGPAHDVRATQVAINVKALPAREPAPTSPDAGVPADLQPSAIAVVPASTPATPPRLERVRRTRRKRSRARALRRAVLRKARRSKIPAPRPVVTPPVKQPKHLDPLDELKR